MADENPRQRFVTLWVIPIVTAIIGGVAGSLFQASSFDNAQISDIVSVLKDPALSADQKLKALEIYQQITDRPWGIMRSVMTYLGVALGSVIGALTVGGFFQRK